MVPNRDRPSGRAAAAALAAAVAAVLAGCPSQREYTDPDALVVATYAGFAEQAAVLTAAWRAAHPGTTIAFAALEPSDFQQAMYPRLLTGAHVPDVLVVDAAYLARFGPGPLLEELSAPGSPEAAAIAGLPAAALAQGTAGGRLVGVATDRAPLVLFHRGDVTARAGVTAAELGASWEGFVAACRKVRAATGAFCLSSEAELLDWALRTGLEAGASPYVSAAGEPFPDGARVRRALELARAAAEAGIVSRAAPGTDRWRELLREGRIAVQAGGPAMLRALERSNPRAAGRWRMAPLPEGAALSAPSAFCALAARGARKELARELLRGACLDREAQVAAWQEARAFPALPSAAADPRLDAPVPYLGGQVVGPMLRAATAGLRPEGWDRMEPFAVDTLVRELDAVVARRKPVAQALAEARAELGRRLERRKR